MEISKDAVLRIVKAIQLSTKMAKALSQFTHGENDAELITAKLEGVLYEISGEKAMHEHEIEFDFAKSKTYHLLYENVFLNDEEVADEFCWMALKNRPKVYVESMKPISREEFAKSVKENGGYLYTPEGEFSK